MFDNIGRKIKMLGKCVFAIGSVTSTVSAVYLLSEELVEPLGCILIAVGGCLSALISAWLLYGFGELIEKTSQNEENTRELVRLQMNQRFLGEDDPIIQEMFSFPDCKDE